MAITQIDQPSGYNGDGNYRWYLNDETQNVWKARCEEMPQVERLDVDGITQLAPNQWSLSFTVSHVDPTTGLVFRENDLPIVSDPHTHTFNQTELSDPAFDVATAIEAIIFNLIAMGEFRLANAPSIQSLISNW